jgi:probable DNA repair protein
MGASRRVWNTPDVLPWQAWTERLIDSARARGDNLPRRLRAVEEWLLWREAVREACAGLELLAPDALIDSIRHAAELADDWNLRPQAETAEAALLLHARQLYAERCQALGAIDSSHYWRLLPRVEALSRADADRGGEGCTWLVGFAELGPARVRELERRGARVLAPVPRTEAAAAAEIAACTDGAGELTAAARWARACLQRDPSARLLLVVPRLPQCRHQLISALSQTLDAASILTPRAADAPLFAIEGGQPLDSYPLVAAALDIFALAAGVAQSAQLSAVLRSPYLDAINAAASAASGWRFDVWLREQNINEARPASLRALLATVAQALGAATRAMLQTLLSAIETPAHVRQLPSNWARLYAQMLQRCGWPGADLSSEEQQIRQRFEQLIGDFAALDGNGSLSARALTVTEAHELLRTLAGTIAFEPASDDVPVTVSAYLGDPIVRYDGIWVAGLSYEVWPQSATPDPLLPLTLQLAAALPQASAAGQLQCARTALQRWRNAGRQLVLSWSRTEGELEREPSPLLAELASANTELGDANATAAPAATLVRWLRRDGRLESFSDEAGTAWPPGNPLPGGTRLLELQALCPFRSFAELRLHAHALPQPMPGIDPRVRGQLLHRALELFWRQTPDSASLKVRTAAASTALIERCVAQGLREILAPGAVSPDARLLQLEQQRAVRVIEGLLEWERQREPFTVAQLEWRRVQPIGAFSLSLRLDRVDRLSQGGLIVIDYKTGAAESFDPHAERQPRPQLPAYALAAGDEVVAVAMAYLGRDGLKWRGLADHPQRLAGVPAPKPPEPDWIAVRAHWYAQLSELVHEFAAGHAAVLPLPHACEHCHLQLLCRVERTALPFAEATADGGSDE